MEVDISVTTILERTGRRLKSSLEGVSFGVNGSSLLEDRVITLGIL